MVLAAVLVVIFPIWRPGYPWGSDTWGHLHRANYMQQMIREYGWVDGFLKSAWMTDWYMGDPTRVYYPPLTNWVLGGLSGLTGDVFVAYRLFVSGVLALLALSVYTVGVWWNHSPWMATLGAVLAITAPYTLRTIFSEGNLPRALVVLALPWMIWGAETILTHKRTGWMLALLALLWAFALTAHVMQAAMFAVVVGLYVVARLLVNVYIPIRRVPLALLPVFLGGILAAFYLIPAYSHLELRNVPYLPASKVDLFSISLDALRPIQQGLEDVNAGSLPLILVFVLALISRARAQRALLAVALIGVLLAFGNASAVYRLVPLNHTMLPERFLNATAVLLPLIVATLPQPARSRRMPLAAAVLVVLLVEFPSVWRMVHMRPLPPDDLSIATELANRPLQGRAASLTLPNPTAPQIYLTSETGGRDHVSGWGLENTPHQDALRRLAAGMSRSPAYVERMLALWNADYALIRPGTGFIPDHFALIAETPTLDLWERDQPSAFIQTLPDQRMLVIGQNATSWLFAFPFATEGYAANPGAYDADYLEHFSVIGLNRFEGSAAALTDWVERGNTLIVDLSGFDPVFNQGYNLFDVQAYQLSLPEPLPVRWTEALANLPATFPSDETPWIGATYANLDAVLASVRYHDQEYPLLGHRRVGAGQVWYIGFNLLYWLDIHGQQDALAQLVDYMLASSDVDRSLSLPPLPVTDLARTVDRVSFTYTADAATNTILSMTYFPRWRFRVDGEPLQTFNHEHLVGLKLPPGTHTVTLRYEPYSRISWLGAAVSLLGAAGVVALAVVMNRRPALALEDRAGFFFDRHASHTVPPLPQEEAHTTCPRCGYEKALIGPPTTRSYPFVSVTCPECGYEI